MANDVLERGDIYFAYRPRVEQEQVHDIEEVQRLFVILQPSDGDHSRRLVIGRKHLPQPEEHERLWGFVDEVVGRPETVEEELERRTYDTRTRGKRTQPEARPAGEGRYAIVRHGSHTHLSYELELPEQPGAVQQELTIEPEASYILAIKNPLAGAPAEAGLPPQQRPDLPGREQERFGRRRFTDADPELLDQEGIEFVLIGAAHDVEEELDVRLDTEAEDAESADIFPPTAHATREAPHGTADGGRVALTSLPRAALLAPARGDEAVGRLSRPTARS
ncbi:hypothetical protein Sipo8835_18480 [Streptomyces ipomoeae]|nr:hypothetical protein [Streptomyces ipomoeae]MDX2697348.1 hypothetical protein [Streptomyces ipomoeae]MDX2827646.1 hypothetical protein [Streptomyces ipomoeae]MDX2845779.1 hypothetical protein [Streptomyces ipomoeae]MDX2880287.1 hypothetical protein [Streptomyces ipomoeae]TQE33320.1 hypothetical protein Sipo8835_18480 [Streptomyces ipomoeae]